jgi:hypothetical protein
MHGIKNTTGIGNMALGTYAGDVVSSNRIDAARWLAQLLDVAALRAFRG